MAKINIGPAFESLSLSKPSAVRKDRGRRAGSVKRKKTRTRLNQSQFLELSQAEKKRYLERFPKSKHRRLMKGDDKPAKKDKGAKSKGPIKQSTLRKKAKQSKKPAEEKFTKKISRAEFDDLSKKDQKAYKKKYPTDSFRGKKHFIAKKPSVIEQKRKGDMGEKEYDGSEKVAEVRNRRKAEKQALKKDRDQARSELRHSVTHESVKALKDSKPKDLKKAAANLRAERSTNVMTIKDTLDSKNEHIAYSKSDLRSIDRAIELDGQNEDSQWSEENRNKAKKIRKRLNPDTPNEVTEEERELLDQLQEENGINPKKRKPFWKQDLETLSKFMSGEEIDPDGRSNAMIMLGVVSRYALLAAGVSALALGSGPAALHIAQTLFGQWDDFSSTSSSDEYDEDADVEESLFAVYDAVTDHIDHMDHEEMVEDITKAFKEFGKVEASAQDDVLNDLFHVCVSLGCRMKAKSKTHLDFERRSVRRKRILDAIARTAVSHDYHPASDLSEIDKDAAIEELVFLSKDKRKRITVYMQDGVGTQFSIYVGAHGNSGPALEDLRL